MPVDDALDAEPLAGHEQLGRGEIAEIFNFKTSLAKGAKQPHLAKGDRRLLLPGPVGTGAGGNPDQAEPGHRFPLGIVLRYLDTHQHVGSIS